MAVCGIAGYSRSATSEIDPFEAARVLLASVAERGADAAGCAFEADDGTIEVDKQTGGASRFFDRFAIPRDLNQILLHVRDHTKGRPSLLANNHPIRHGHIVGVHNGRIENDEAIFAALGCGRAEHGMTVDSEAIFALLNWLPSMQDALARLRGAFSIGWYDERRPGHIFLARGYGRPLWTARTEGGDFIWASTLEALEIVEEFLKVCLFKRPVTPGTIFELKNGEVLNELHFEADAQAEWLLNPVASPDERAACLAALLAS